MNVSVSDELKSKTKDFTKQFIDHFNGDGDGCKKPLNLDKRMRDENQHHRKCLSLNVFESLTSWLMENKYNLCPNSSIHTKLC